MKLPLMVAIAAAAFSASVRSISISELSKIGIFIPPKTILDYKRKLGYGPCRSARTVENNRISHYKISIPRGIHRDGRDRGEKQITTSTRHARRNGSRKWGSLTRIFEIIMDTSKKINPPEILYFWGIFLGYQ
jgi:hypothetical protein